MRNCQDLLCSHRRLLWQDGTLAKTWVKWARKLCKEVGKYCSEQKDIKTFRWVWAWCVCGTDWRPPWLEWKGEVWELSKELLKLICYKEFGLWYIMFKIYLFGCFWEMNCSSQECKQGQLEGWRVWLQAKIPCVIFKAIIIVTNIVTNTKKKNWKESINLKVRPLKRNKLFKALATLASKKRTHISKIRNNKRTLQLTMEK